MQTPPQLRTTLLVLLVQLFSATVATGQSATLIGTISDGDGEVLPFVNVGITTLGLGGTTELDGTYRINNIPVGTHTVEVSYLGYGTETVEMTFAANETKTFDTTLSEAGGLQLTEVVVTGQAEGQRAAINQQINSNTIVNVVSKEKLQELPDQNAAESLGRLSGVSVFRDAGEGQRISVRGISPRLNNITINGQRLPSTQVDDRSTDLSMISPDMLEGIELYKALTPDRDGDAIGGSVNFTVAKARKGLRANVRALGTYNDLVNTADNYRLNASLSNRFGGKDQFGYIATANYQRINRSNEFISVDYEFLGTDDVGNAVLPINTLNVGFTDEIRIRGGGSATLDFTPNKQHGIVLSSTAGYTERDDERYRKRYRLGTSEQRYDARRRDRDIWLVSNSLSGDHVFGDLNLTWAGSYSFSRQNMPYSLDAGFQELNATTGNFPDNGRLEDVPSVFRNNLDATLLRSSDFETNDVDEDHFTGQVDLQYDLRLGEKTSGFLKTGAKVRRVERSSDLTAFESRPYLNDFNVAIDDPERFIRNANGSISLANFLGGDSRDDFLGGSFNLLPGGGGSFNIDAEGFDLEAYNQLFNTEYASLAELPLSGIIDLDRVDAFYGEYAPTYRRDIEGDLADYDGFETVTSGYLMGQINVGPRWMFVGGVRLENTVQEYSSREVGTLDEDDPLVNLLPPPTVVEAGRSYTNILPQFQTKYQFTEWFDARAAVTKSLARPDYQSVVPYVRINTNELELFRGDPDLENTVAWNYDLFLSFYNSFGLLTVGAFHKQLRNVDYLRQRAILDRDDPFNGYRITEPDNIPESTVSGVEIDLQGNLRNATPRFLKGFVFGVNLTLLTSETSYPFFQIDRRTNPTPPPFFTTTITDTVRAAPLVGQADVIANLNLGYEIGGFSGRVSAQYQGNSLSPGNAGIGSNNSGVSIRAAQDVYDQEFWRMDLALKQQVSSQITVVLNVNNLLDTPEQTYLLGTTRRLPASEEYFGRTADLGFQWKFNR
jgi:TonB-dependent receptor